MKKVISIYKKNKEVINYLIFGVLTTIISLCVKWLLLFTILDQNNAFELQSAIIISWIIAILFAYITNRKYVFESKNKKKFQEFLNFLIARISTLFLEMFIMWFFVTLLKFNSNLWVVIFTIISQIIVIISNYIFSKIFVFKKEANES